MDDSQFSKTQNPNDDDNNVNCHECTGGFVSPDYTGVCVEIVCGSHKVVKNGYDNTLQFDDQENCVCRNDANNNGKCDETENFKCGADDAPEACNGEELNEPAGDAHKESLCYYADSNNVGYNNPSEPIAPMKHANCDGVAAGCSCTRLSLQVCDCSRAASVSEIRTLPNDKTKDRSFCRGVQTDCGRSEDDQEAPKGPSRSA